MGYFANGTEGTIYEDRYCRRCVHQATEDRGCPVFDLHLLYNYEQHKKDSTRLALEMFIPRLDGGANGECVMFWERGRSGHDGGEPIQVTAPLTIVKAA